MWTTQRHLLDFFFIQGCVLLISKVFQVHSKFKIGLKQKHLWLQYHSSLCYVAKLFFFFFGVNSCQENFCLLSITLNLCLFSQRLWVWVFLSDGECDKRLSFQPEMSLSQPAALHRGVSESKHGRQSKNPTSWVPIQSGPNPICLPLCCKLLCALSLQIAVNYSQLASCIT